MYSWSLLFSFQGRIDRKTFSLLGLLTLLLIYMAYPVMVYLLKQLLDYHGEWLHIPTEFYRVPGLLVLVLTLWIILAFFMKRAHDIGWKGWMCWWLIVAPTLIAMVRTRSLDKTMTIAFVVAILLGLVFTYKKGASKANEYGPVPLPVGEESSAPGDKIDDKNAEAS